MKKNITCTPPVLLLGLLFAFSAATAAPVAPGTYVLYGMTSDGGVNGLGAIIKFNPATDSESVVWSLGSSASDGQSPNQSLALDPVNNLLYAMTYDGGSNGAGAIIRFNPANDSESVVWSFGAGMDGSSPSGNLVYNTTYNLFYGMTYGGGLYGAGAIFTFNPVNDSETVVWNFGLGTDGQHPEADLVVDPVNNQYYGTASDGGSNAYGAIFRFDPATNTDTVVWSFGAGTDGWGPGGNLSYNFANGYFYGLTEYGGTNGLGALFVFDPLNNTESVAWNFGAGTDGKHPYRSLVHDAGTGLYYGLTATGGTGFVGTLFGFNPVTDTETVVYNFATGGAANNPSASLVYDAGNGLYYATCYSGGANTAGGIVSFNASDDSVSLVWSFGYGQDGASPLGDLLPYNVTSTGIAGVTGNRLPVSVFPNPTTGHLSVTGLTAGQTVELYNCLGQKITGFTATGPTLQLDVPAPAGGLYLLQVLNTDGTPAAVQKVLKL